MPRFIKPDVEVEAFRLTTLVTVLDGGQHLRQGRPGDWLVRHPGPNDRVEFFNDECFRRSFRPAGSAAELELRRRLPGIDAAAPDRVSLAAANEPAAGPGAAFDPDASTLDGYACGDCGPLEGPARRPGHLPGLEDWERQDLADDRTHDERAP